MADGDAARTGRYQASGVPRLARARWRLPHGPFFSSPVVAAGVVYVGGTDGNVYAIDAASGHLRWRVDTGDGVSSQPAVARGIVCVGSVVNAIEGRFSALDAASGRELWRFDPGHKILGSSPTATDGRVYLARRTPRQWAGWCDG